MLDDNRTIIADSSTSPRSLLLFGILAGSLIIGAIAAVYYANAGLTLSHYDARAHLVVARRIVDSLTPGWKQIGAVWLPLPHLLNLPIVQWDWAYATGFPSTALSVLSVSAGLSALALFLLRRTGSIAAAIVAPAVILLNPNVLYLQSTPMTEPMLIGLSLVSLYLVDRWIERDDRVRTMWAGVAISALALTRYEGWFVAGALVALGAWARRRDGEARALALVPYFVVSVVGFLLLGKAATGTWFVTSGFFEPDTETWHQLSPAMANVARGVHDLSGPVLMAAAVGGVGATIFAVLRRRFGVLLLLALVAAAALPLYAFYQGHPFRIRYMVPLVVACGALSVIPIALLPRRLQWPVAAALAGAIIWQSPPFDDRAAMVVEAQWETPHRLDREIVTRYLAAEWDGTPILASMGSLGHYMQEASHADFAIADFVHEGNGALWSAAVDAPERYVRWILIEERAEGGDVFSAKARADEQFVKGFERVAEGGGVALYRKR